MLSPTPRPTATSAWFPASEGPVCTTALHQSGSHMNRRQGVNIEFLARPTANPHLAFATMLMAGIDGIQNKIHPGDAADKDLTTCPLKKRQTSRQSRQAWRWPSVPGGRSRLPHRRRRHWWRLTRTLNSAGGCRALNMTTHPVELTYYSL